MASEERKSGLWLLALLPLVPLLYVLSFGPVVMVAGRAGWDKGTIQAVYAPIIWLHRHTPLRGPIQWYGRMWGIQ